MLVDFETLPKTSRVWVYQSNRSLNQEENKSLENKLKDFVKTWQAHNQDLKGSAKILKNRFFIIALDENFNKASGCSIDASVHFLQKLEKEFNLNLFDRSVTFLHEGNIESITIPEVQKAIEAGKINKETTVFNNLVSTIEALESTWENKAVNSWLKRYF